MGMTTRYRFRNYTIARDETAAPTYAAECVTGDDADCGESSGEHVVKPCRQASRSAARTR